MSLASQSRRLFLKFAATTSGLVFSGFSLASNNNHQLTHSKHPNSAEFPLLIIHPDNSITVFNSRAEMGQGSMTSLTQLLFEDLGADWQQLREVKHGWADASRFGHQNTIGAISSLIGWNVHRQVGGKINRLLRQAASKVWQVPFEQVSTQGGKVYNQTTKQSLTFGQLSKLVSTVLPDDRVELVPAESLSIIGKSKPRLDVADKITGKAKFGIDVQLPQLKVAVVVKCPVFGGKLKSFDASNALQLPGVLQIFQVPSGLAIVAESYWQATKARQAVTLTWDYGKFATQSSASLMAEFKAQLDDVGQTMADQGEFAKVATNKSDMLVRDFSFPLVAHMTMEPMNCTVWLREEQCDIWAPTQNPNDARTSAAGALSLDITQVNVNMTFMGGGFGRRAQDDFVIEACHIAKKCTFPIKLMWSREDDVQHDYYRPMNAQRITTKLKDNKIYAWQHKVATNATSPYHFSLQDRDKPDGDWVAYGGADSSLYNIEHFQTQVTLTKSPLTVGILRGISHGYTHFAIESVVDELAEVAGVDPIEFRLAQIEEKRAKKVLTLLQDKLSTLKLSNQQALGIAFGHEKAPSGPYQYYNAVAAIVERTKETIKVQKLLVVLDHGQVINPDGLLAQVQGSAVFAASMMFEKTITIAHGKVEQSNFHDYPVARIDKSIEIELLTTGNTEWPMGVGEKLQGTIQPAIANALYQLTGKRINSLPVDLSTFAESS